MAVMPVQNQPGSSIDIDESTPLLAASLEASHVDHDKVYKRFSTRSKRFIVAMVSFSGLISMFMTSTFIPCIPQIAKDLNSTGAVISLAVSLSVFSISTGALAASTYSTFYGRRAVYLTLFPLLTIASFGVASAQTVPQLMVWRVLQAAGASPGLSVGGGVIGDIYKLDERGGAMGIFFACVLIGPTLAPFIGGFAAHYSSWRVIQAIIGLSGFLNLIVLFCYLPETSHPGQRGIEKLEAEWKHPKWRPVLLNPIRPLALMRSPNLLFVSLAGFFALLTDYVLLVPLAYTIGERYGITNEAVIGACFLPVGLGNMIGAPLSGMLSDYIVVKWRANRGGVWYPEDRLRATPIGALFLVPLTVVASGVVTTYVDDKVTGLTLNMILFLLHGLGVDIVFTPSAAYIVDVMHSRSAEGTAANNASRSLLLSVCIAGILPIVERYGVLVTNTLAGGLALLGFVLLWTTIQYGEKLRRWGDVGYSTDETN